MVILRILNFNVNPAAKVKRMKKLALLMMVFASFGITGCQTLQNQGTKQTIGTGAGAILGGVLGSKVGKGSGQLWATGAGALVGAMIGNEIGKSLDQADRTAMTHAMDQAHQAPVGEPISWNNPQSGNSGEVVATKDGYSSSGKYCREYQQKVFIGGEEQTAYGRACQQPDGSWQIVQ